MSITITQAAADRILETARSEGVALEDSFLRLAVLAGGCSGLTYDLGWDSVKHDNDELIETAGLRVILDESALLYLDGTTLHFSAGLDGQGFYFDNPQAERTCACGESFSV